VNQLRQHALFTGETLTPGRRQPRIAENFDGNDITEIFALGKVHNSHAAFAQKLLYHIGPEFLTLKRCDISIRKYLVRDVCYVLVQYRMIFAIGFQHGENFGAHGIVVRACSMEKCVPLFVRQIKAFVKQFLNVLPPVRIHIFLNCACLRA